MACEVGVDGTGPLVGALLSQPASKIIDNAPTSANRLKELNAKVSLRSVEQRVSHSDHHAWTPGRAPADKVDL